MAWPGSRPAVSLLRVRPTTCALLTTPRRHRSKCAFTARQTIDDRSLTGSGDSFRRENASCSAAAEVVGRLGQAPRKCAPVGQIIGLMSPIRPMSTMRYSHPHSHSHSDARRPAKMDYEPGTEMFTPQGLLV